MGSAMLPENPGYQAPLPPQSGRPSGRCGVGPALALEPESGPFPNWPGSRNGPGSLASCWPHSERETRQPIARAVRTRLLLRLAVRRNLPREVIAVDLGVQALFFALAGALERIQHHVVALMTRIFVHDIVRVHFVGHVDLPWLGPGAGVAD